MAVPSTAPNLLDRMLRVVAPGRAARHARARAQLAAMDALQAHLAPQPSASVEGYGYDSTSSYGPQRNYRPRRRDADGDILPGLPDLRGQSRDLARNHPIGVGAIATNVNRIVGTGLTLVAEPVADVLGWAEDQRTEWKQQVQREFSLWADSDTCTWEANRNFYGDQAIALQAALESGDCMVLLPDGDPSAQQPYRLRLQLLEADRCGNPDNGADTAEIAGGIRRSNGRPTACYIYDRHPGAVRLGGGARYTGQWYDLVGASGRRRVLHVCNPKRPEQSRGVPYLAPIIGLLKQLGRYTEAEIQAAVISAFFTVFVKTESGSPAPIFGASDPNQPIAPAAGELAMGPGMINGLAPNEDVSFANPGRPNPNYDGFVQAILQLVGVALGIPRELLLKTFNSSYSASKAAILDAWVYFRTMRAWLARIYCQPVYETWLAEAVSRGRISAPGFFTDPLTRWAYTRAAWYGDSMGSINPKDEVAAYASAIDARLMTRERAEWELFGTDFSATLSQKAREQQQLEQAGLPPVARPGAAPGAAGNAPTETQKEPA